MGDVALRRALTLAIDRPAIVKNVFDTLAYLSIGPVTRAQWTADTAIAMPTHDLAAAKALLDSLGWVDHDGDGVRDKGGRALAFSLLTPSSSAPRRQAAVLMQAQWKDVGARVTLEDMEFNTFVERISTGKFDVVMHGLHNDPSPSDLRANFGSPPSTKDFAANYGGYSSPVVDAALDSAAREFDVARSKALYQRAYARIVDDAAAIFLYEPKLVAGVNRRVETGPLPAGGWWTTIAEWRITPGAQIARDRVPLDAGESTAAR